jgi:hypothetical protein
MKNLYAGEYERKRNHEISNEKYTLKWLYGDDYLTAGCSSTIILKGEHSTTKITIFGKSDLKMLNKMFNAIGFNLITRLPRVKDGETYFYINEVGDIEEKIEKDDYIDLERWDCGNYFRTECEVKKSKIYKSYNRN